MRYLAELAWIPPAIALNQEISWRDLGADVYEAATEVHGRQVAVELQLNAGGDIVEAHADARPRAEGTATTHYPWGGLFSHHREMSGMRLPAHAEVYWDLPEGRFIYWRGEVTGLTIL